MPYVCVENLLEEKEKLIDALKVFAEFGKKLGPVDVEGFDILIYEMAGDGTKLVGDDFRKAYKILEEVL